MQQARTSGSESRWRVGLLGAIVSALAVLYIVTGVNLNAVAEAFRRAHYGWVLLSAMIITCGLMFRGLRWWTLIGAPPVMFWRVFHIVNVSYLVNGILPLRIGELARVYLATRLHPPVPPMKAAGTIILERLLDVIAVLIILAIGAAGVPTLPPELRATAASFVPLAAIGLTMLLIAAAAREQVKRLLARVFPTPIAGRLDLARAAGEFLDGLAPLTQPRALLLVVGSTTAAWVCSVLSGYVLMLAFYPQADWTATLLATAAASLAVAVPAVPGNLGTYEASIMVAMNATPFATPESAMIAFALTVHFVNLMINASMGAFGLWREGVSLTQLTSGVRGLRTPSADVIALEPERLPSPRPIDADSVPVP